MVKTLACTHGHHWRIADDAIAETQLREMSCPMCGAHAETVVEDSEDRQTRNDGRHVAASSDPNRLTGYEILDEAGRGGMGVVYRALDHQHNRIVALKTLQRIDAVALHRFKKEFRSLSDIAHPNLVSLYELISDGETWCFTMELIDGVDLLQYVHYGPGGRKDLDSAVGDATIELDPSALLGAGRPALSPEQLDRLRSVVGQLTSGILALHAAGILHRDIKPSNVLVTGEGRALLLDFGLAAELDGNQIHLNSQENILGTVAYMSPEQAASNAVTNATDWYSVGSLLYEALTGQPPFTGKTLRVLQAKQNEDPPRPSEFWPQVPRDLEQLCMRLLHRDPEQRAGGSEVLSVLAQDEAVTAAPPSSSDTVNHLIGREQHLAALRGAYADVQDGRAATVFVRGESGNGKTTLLQHFMDETAQHEKTVVLSGRCYERESVPFKAIDSLVDSLVAHLAHLPRAEAEAVMPRDVHSLARLFPVIGQIKAAVGLPRRKTEITDQQERNRRAIAALRELLARMGDRCRLVVYIDDLQWGDEDSAAMVSDLLQPPDPPVLLFLGTYRSEDAETSPFLNAFRQIQLQREASLEILQIDVKPLEHADAVRLAMALLSRDDADARRNAEAIARESAGNPYFVSELVKHLQLKGERISESSEPLAVVDVVWSRVQQLPETSRRLLEVVALWGQPLPLDQAMRIADVEQSSVGPLRAGHLIRTVGSSSSSIVETYHDRVRESVSQRLESALRQQHHLRIAEDYARQSPLQSEQIIQRLENVDHSGGVDDPLDVPSVWYDLAFHYDASGRSDLAFPYALATAESARAQFSLEVSEQQYRIARRGVKGDDEANRCRIAEGLGDVLMLRGKYPESAEQFETARKLIADTDARARIEGKIGELAFKCGDNKRAAEALERSLRLLGRRIPTHAAAFATLLAWEVFVQTLHTILPKLFLFRRSLKGADKEFLAIRLYTRLAYAYFFERGKVPCLWTHLRAINLAERYPPTLDLAHAWSTHAPVMALLPWVARGEEFAKRSLEMRKDLGDVWGQGPSLHYWGVVLFTGARYDECISKCKEAVRLLERTGDYWEVNMARWQGANAVFRKGELRQAVAEAKRLYEITTEMGDDKVAGFCLDTWSRGTGGQIPTDVTQREMQRQRHDVQATAQVLLAEAVRLVGANELDQAVNVLSKAHQVCRNVGMQNAWVSPILPWLAATHRLQAEQATDAGSRQQFLNRARRAARQALAISQKFQSDLPHALRECGLIAAMQGKVRKARKCLDDSLVVAEKQGARFEHAQTLLARGQIGQQNGWPEAEQDLANAKESLRKLGADFILEHTERGMRN